MTTASAPGKVILLGEHAAVYGNPVLVASVDLRTYVTVTRRNDDKFLLNNTDLGIENFSFEFSEIPKLKGKKNLSLTMEGIERIFEYMGMIEDDGIIGMNLDITSDIPVASGLGSSASVASALVLAITTEFNEKSNEKLNKNEIANLAWDIENIVHKKSSGVDPFAVAYGGVIRYKKGEVERVNVKKYPKITIGNSELISDTGEVVGDVMRLKESFPEFFCNYLRSMAAIVDYGQKFMEEGDLEKFGEIMNINHGLLSSIGVSCPKLDRMVWAARKNSPGAKLCGAGRGGIMIALGDVGKEIEKAGGDVIKTKICDEGVRIDE